MLEFFLTKERKKSVTKEIFYHGLVPSSSVIDGKALASAIKLTSGTEITANTSEPWLSFTLDGKKILVAKKAYRHSVPWIDIYDIGAVYGTGDNGVPSNLSTSGMTLTPQTATVLIGGKRYRVRLPKGSNVNPCPDVVGVQLDQTLESEWDRIFYSIAAARPGSSVYTGPIFADFTDVELGILDRDVGEGYGGYSWCQEHHAGSSRHRVCRGFYTPTMLYRETYGLSNAGWGWRPILEEV